MWGYYELQYVENPKEFDPACNCCEKLIYAKTMKSSKIIDGQNEVELDSYRNSIHLCINFEHFCFLCHDIRFFEPIIRIPANVAWFIALLLILAVFGFDSTCTEYNGSSAIVLNIYCCNYWINNRGTIWTIGRNTWSIHQKQII